MRILKIISYLCLRAACLTFILIPNVGFAQSQITRGEVRAKAAELKQLAQEKGRGAEGVAEAVRLYRQAKRAAKEGNLNDASDLLDNALALLKGTNVSPNQTANSLYSEHQSYYSPFGFHPAWILGGDVPLFSNAQDIGIKWHRPSRYLFWMLVQKNIHTKQYDWVLYDRMMQELPGNMHVLMNITTLPIMLVASLPPEMIARMSEKQRKAKRLVVAYGRQGTYLPNDVQSYQDFVKAAVERYDGDGLDDMPGLKNPIKIWQVDNEPPKGLDGYTALVKMTYEAIKEADPQALVMLGGATGPAEGGVQEYIHKFDKEFFPILKELGGRYVDIFDFHWYGNATGDYKKSKQIYDYIRSALDKAGFSKSLPVWITEMGTYSGKPQRGAVNFNFQTERQQAADIVKRYVYPLSFGVKKVFLAFGLEEGFKDDDNYFEHTGLIYNGKFLNDLGRGVKKLGYYTYKKMTEILEGSDWNNIQTIQGSDGVYIYKFSKNGKPIWVAWNDTEQEKQITISGIASNQTKIIQAVPKYETGKEVTDYNTAFGIETKAVQNGNVEITLSGVPVFAEEE